MPASDSVTPTEVSVIIPARNEEARLAACLQSLVAQTGVTFEVIVVDDHSTDRTAEIAASFPGVRVISAPDLPEHWTGKNNAMAAGAQVAKGNWLLFTDADTVHAPGSLDRALAEAQQRGAGLLSYSPQQEVQGAIKKAVMEVIFAELACTYRPRDVCDPALPSAAANGQYLLISREAYESVGGHRAISSDLLEDVALARAAKRAGHKIFFRYGGDAVRTRMYENFAQLVEGWTKNLALLFPGPATLAARRLAEFVLILASTAVSIVAIILHNPEIAAVCGVVAVASWAALFTRIRKAHFSWDANVLAIFGLPLFAYLLLRSKLTHIRGNVTWKGRRYAASAPAAVASEPVPLQGQTWFT